jgi:hypothetical protein
MIKLQAAALIDWITQWSCPIRPDRPRAGNCA